MILKLIGLGLSFLGSFCLACGVLINFGKPKSFVQIMYPDDKQNLRVFRYDRTKRGIKGVNISKEEIKLIIFLSFLSLGFFLQILDFFI